MALECDKCKKPAEDKLHLGWLKLDGAMLDLTFCNPITFTNPRRIDLCYNCFKKSVVWKE